MCFRVGDLEGMIQHLMANGVRMIDETPRKGAGGMRIAFVHPKSRAASWLSWPQRTNTHDVQR